MSKSDHVENPIQEGVNSLDIQRGGSAIARASEKQTSGAPVDDIPQRSADNGPDLFLQWPVLLVLAPFFLFQGIMNGVSNSYGTLLYTQHYGVGIKTTTNINIALGVGGFFSLFLSIFVSKVSDSIKSNFGRRKPFVVAGIIVQFVAVLILSFPSAGNSSTYPAQVALGTLAGTIGNSLWSVPLNSWFIESIRNQATYSIITAIQGVFAVFGYVMAIVVGAIGNQPMVPLAGAVILGIIFLPLVVYIVPNPVLQQAPAQPPLVPSIRTCVRTAEFRTILLNTIALIVGLGLSQEFLFLVLYSSFGFTKMKEVNSALFLTAIAVPIATLFMLPISAWSVGKFEKIHLYRGLSVFLWVLAILSVVGMSPGLQAYNGTSFSDATLKDYYLLYIVAMIGIIGLCSVPIGFMNSLFLRDLVLYDNFVNNTDRENVYQQALSVPVSVIGGVIAGFFKALLYATGFDHSGTKNANDDYIAAQYSWNEGSLIQIATYTVIIVSISTFIAVYTLRDYPLTTVVAEQMTKVVKRRAAAKAAEFQERDEDTTRESVISRAKEDAEKQVFIDEVNLWNSLSRSEVDHIVNSPTVDGGNQGLKEIRYRNFLGAGIFAPAAIGAMLYGAISQLIAGGNWSTMAITLFPVPVFYMYYEVTRMFEMDNLSKLSLEDLKEQAEAAKASNDKYQVTVMSLIDENGIILEDDFAESKLPTTGGQRSRASSSLARPLPEDPLSGYKRQWGVMVVLTIGGVLLGALA